ncbi:MAG TPA: CotH kinase family protein [Ohtaekwangia sp.]|uniref:CotH kinase family protein n=1 Tax=Ohtaekwangia sp. TaxID=2066019 RepID=UPI002F92D59E
MIRHLTLSFIFVSACALAQSPTVEFTSSNLPIVVISTNEEIKDDPKIVADMGIIYNGVGVRNNVSDAFNNFTGKIGIEIRGSSSQLFPKKQYGIELRDATGVEGKEASLLGLPKEEDWILFAPYNDKSLMRDALSYKLGRDLGHYATRTKYVELVLNGNYEGIYVLMEKIKRDKNRVNIEKLDPEETDAANITGGYIIKIDKTTGDSGEGWYSPHKPAPSAYQQSILFQYEYPKYNEIVPEQKAYIQQYIAAFENALAGDQFKDPANGYAKYIDVNSFIDYLIVQEITKNVDGYRLSAFFYKDSDAKGGKLVMGPIWDFNLGFGNADYCDGGSPQGFAKDFNTICDFHEALVPFWWNRLVEDEAFRQKLSTRWQELRTSTLKTSVIHQYIDSVASVLNQESQQRNFTRWPVLNTYVWPNYYIGATYQQEVVWLKSWISQRLTWLDDNFREIVTATEQEQQTADIAVYPNPFSGAVHIAYTLRKPAAVEITIYNAVGNRVHSETIEHLDAGKKIYTRDMGNASGLYYYTIKRGDAIVARGKLVAQ